MILRNNISDRSEDKQVLFFFLHWFEGERRRARGKEKRRGAWREAPRHHEKTYSVYDNPHPKQTREEDKEEVEEVDKEEDKEIREKRQKEKEEAAKKQKEEKK